MINQDNISNLLALEILSNVKIKKAIVSIVRKENTLIFKNQIGEEFIFDLHNLDMEVLTSNILEQTSDYTDKNIENTKIEINKAISELLESTNNLDLKIANETKILAGELNQKIEKENRFFTDKFIDYMTKSETEELFDKTTLKVDSESERLLKEINVLNEKLPNYFEKSEIVNLTSDQNKNTDTKISKLLSSLENAKKELDIKITEIVKKINLVKLDSQSFVQDSYLKNNSLYVVKSGKAEKKGTVISRGGGGGSGEGSEFFYTNSLPMPKKVGGLAKGSTFDKVSQKDLWTLLLYDYNEPFFTSFYIENIKLVYEVGEAIESGQYKAIWTTQDAQMFLENSISIEYKNEQIILAEGLNNVGFYLVTFPEIMFSEYQKLMFEIKGMSTTQTEFKKTWEIEYMYKIYYGESDLEVLNSESIKTLRASKLANEVEGTYEMESENYKFICYPKIWGKRSSFIDKDSDLDIAMLDPQVVKITNDFDLEIDYYSYRTFNKLGANVTIIVG
jgi:hypothetical protein